MTVSAPKSHFIHQSHVIIWIMNEGFWTCRNCHMCYCHDKNNTLKERCPNVGASSTDDA